jgi:glycosyltransferase involved in cell wall biosynthesis
MRPTNPLISLVVPCYNEEDAIFLFVREADRVLKGLRLEFVFVNDGSRDGTLALLRKLADQDARVRIINLSRNFGKEAALTAGLDHARGDAVIPMDADLQDPFEVVLQMLEKWNEGHDVVNGYRENRASDTILKRESARWFYNLFNLIADNHIPKNVGDFRLMDARVIEELRKLPERSRFMKGLFAWIGFATTEVSYVRPPRQAGQTSFSFWRLWLLGLEGVFNFSTVPLRIWSYLGFFTATVAFIFGVVIIAKTIFYGRDLPGYASTLTIVLFLGGRQLLTLGIIGVYLSRIFVEVKRRPIYVIDQIHEGSGNAGDAR